MTLTIQNTASPSLKIRSNAPAENASGNASTPPAAAAIVSPIKVNNSGYYLASSTLGSVFLKVYAGKGFELPKTFSVAGIQTDKKKPSPSKQTVGKWQEGFWSYAGGHVMVETTRSGLQIIRNSLRKETTIFDMRTGRVRSIDWPDKTRDMVAQLPSGTYNMIIGFNTLGQPIWQSVKMDTLTFTQADGIYDTTLNPKPLAAVAPNVNKPTFANDFNDNSSLMLYLRAALTYSMKYEVSGPQRDQFEGYQREFAMIADLRDAGDSTLNNRPNVLAKLAKAKQNNMFQYLPSLTAEGDTLNQARNRLSKYVSLNKDVSGEMSVTIGNATAQAILSSAQKVINSRNADVGRVNSRQLLNALTTVKLLAGPSAYNTLKSRIDAENASDIAPLMIKDHFPPATQDKVQGWYANKANHATARKLLIDTLMNNKTAQYTVFNDTTINGTTPPISPIKDAKAATHLSNNTIIALSNANRQITDFMRVAVTAARGIPVHAYLATKYGTDGTAADGSKLGTALLQFHDAVKAGLTQAKIPVTANALWWTITMLWLTAEGIGAVKTGLTVANTPKGATATNCLGLIVRLIGYGIGLWSWRNKINGQTADPNSYLNNFAKAIPLGMGFGDIGAFIGAGVQGGVDFAKGYVAQGSTGVLSGISLLIQIYAQFRAAATTDANQVATWQGLSYAAAGVDVTARYFRDIMFAARYE